MNNYIKSSESCVPCVESDLENILHRLVKANSSHEENISRLTDFSYRLKERGISKPEPSIKDKLGSSDFVSKLKTEVARFEDRNSELYSLLDHLSSIL